MLWGDPGVELIAVLDVLKPVGSEACRLAKYLALNQLGDRKTSSQDNKQAC